MEEAARCLLCHEPPCSDSCPAGTNPGKFIRSIRFRNVKGAAETIREANVLGGVCARVCPTDKLCEEACSRTGIDRPIEIGRLQRFVTDQEKIFGMEILKKGPAKNKKIACVGSGPVSLACAAALAAAGYQVVIYEQKPEPGGVLTYGIIPSRLPKEVVEQEIGRIKKLGVEFKLGAKIGRDLSLEALKSQFDAVFLGLGLWGGKLPALEGIDLKGVYSAVDYLSQAKDSGGRELAAERAVIIGGGDVAMDCASTAKQLGAKTTIVYRRTLEDAPANAAEVKFVQSLGVGFIFQFTPSKILGKDGKVCGFEAKGTDGESELRLKADQVIFAIGQAPEEILLSEKLELTDKKLIKINDENHSTSLKGVFAAGDAVNGGKTVVQAVAEGKTAAFAIMSYLTGEAK
jgi:dihydropyrimidine dehydrogenase (NAD+) subunit PreT